MPTTDISFFENRAAWVATELSSAIKAANGDYNKFKTDYLDKKGSDGSVCLIRRPSSETKVSVKFKRMNTGYDWGKNADAVMFTATYLPGCKDDGSPGQRGTSRVITPSLQFTGAEMKTMHCGVVPLKETDKVRVVHHFLTYETKLVLRSELKNELKDGFEVAPVTKLDPETRKMCLDGVLGKADPDMKAECKKRGLAFDKAKMKDYFWAQTFAYKVLDHIKYHAGKDMVNNGKPPSHAFKSGWGQCGRYSFVMEAAARVHGIPARALANVMGVPKDPGCVWPGHNFHMCVELYLDGVGWVQCEPQGGTLGKFASYLSSDVGLTRAAIEDAKLLYPKLSEMNQGAIDWYFQQYDKDKSGCLDKKEMEGLLCQLMHLPAGSGKSPHIQQNIKHAMALIDVNKDGKISKAELKKGLDNFNIDYNNPKTHPLGQSLATATLYKYGSSSDKSKLSLLGATATPGFSERNVCIIHEQEARYKACQSAGFPADKSNPVHISNFQGYPSFDAVYDKFTVWEVDPLTGKRGKVLSEMGTGPMPKDLFDLKAQGGAMAFAKSHDQVETRVKTDHDDEYIGHLKPCCGALCCVTSYDSFGSGCTIQGEIACLETKLHFFKLHPQDPHTYCTGLKGTIKLNTTSFAACLAAQSSGNLPSLTETKQYWNLSYTDDLLVYLSLYAGKRFPLLNETIQQPAFVRWALRFSSQGEKLADWLNSTAYQKPDLITPSDLFAKAYEICGSNSNTSQFCAFIVSHNVLRTIGRNTTFIDKKGTNYLPSWWKNSPYRWESSKIKIQSMMISLRRDGGGDKFGAWYHNAGLLAYGLHESALLGKKSGSTITRAVAKLNKLLNPIFAGGKEDPVKAQIDTDSAYVIGNYVNRTEENPCPSGAELGDVCNFDCNEGYFAVGNHVCQFYEAENDIFLNNTWNGGRCLPLCGTKKDLGNNSALLRYKPQKNASCYQELIFRNRSALFDHILYSSYRVWQKSRCEKSGLYLDNVNLVNYSSDDVCKGIAATGVTGLGLMMEVLADALQLLGSSNREHHQKNIIKTLETMTNRTPGVIYPRSPDGFAVHFLNAGTGQANDLESCMMCTGLQMAGILFAKTYYSDVDPTSNLTMRIIDLAEQMWETTKFENLLCDTEGKVNSTGEGIPMIQSFDNRCSAVQFPQSDGYYQFNEEIYTVWFAHEKINAQGLLVNTEFWKKWQTRRMYPNHFYQNISLLSLWSGYIVHLPFYTTFPFNSDPLYWSLFRNHWLADWLYFNQSMWKGGQRGKYGLGAGPVTPWCTKDSKSYIADQINGGGSYCRMYSSYILAGYLPVAPMIISNHLLEIMEDGQSVVAFDEDYHILWRTSELDPNFYQGYGITMVDFSSELFGLACLRLGKDFFKNYTNHFKK
eukprot:g1145.t1